MQTNWSTLANNWMGYDANSPGSRTEQYMNSKNWLGISKKNNPFSLGNIGGTMAGLSSIGDIQTGDPRGMWDTADPLFHLAGGRESAVGNTMSDVGVGLTKAGLSSGQPWLALAGGVTKAFGSLFNAAFGVKENKENTDFIKSNTSQALKNSNQFTSATSNEGLIADANKLVGSSNFGWNDLYTNGWFTSKGTRLGNNLIAGENTALNTQFHGLGTGAYNIDTEQDNNVMRNSAAFGGPLFGLGGNISNWSNGMTHINTGGTHEESPYDGVLLGTDNEGTPNLVEEDEIVYGDYVFSNRLTVPEIDKKKDEMSYEDKVLKKYSGKTYAEAAKKAEHISGADERPNDEIAKKGMEAELAVLALSQEKEREIQKLKELEEAIKNMSPEEFAAMQQLLQEQALAEQQAQELAIQLAALEQLNQMTPEELAAMEQLMQQEQQPNIHAEGGSLNEEQLIAEQQLAQQMAAEEQQNLQQADIDRSVPAEEMSTTQLNTTIELIYNWAKSVGDKQLIKEARKAKKASRDDKEEFVEEAFDLIEEYNKQQEALELQKQREQLAATETLPVQLAQMTEEQPPIELQPVETLPLENTFAKGGAMNNNTPISEPLSLELINSKKYAELVGKLLAEAGYSLEAYELWAKQKKMEENPDVFDENDVKNVKSFIKDRNTDIKKLERLYKQKSDFKNLDAEAREAFKEDIEKVKNSGNISDESLNINKISSSNKKAASQELSKEIYNRQFTKENGYSDILLNNTYSPKYEGIQINPKYNEEGYWKKVAEENIAKANLPKEELDALKEGQYISTIDPINRYRYTDAEGTTKWVDLPEDSSHLTFSEPKSQIIDGVRFNDYDVTGNINQNFFEDRYGNRRLYTGDVSNLIELNNPVTIDKSNLGTGISITSKVYKAPEHVNIDEDTFPQLKTWPYKAAIGLLGANLMHSLARRTDYSYPDAIINLAEVIGRPALIGFRPAGNYISYTPADIWAEQNRLDANTRATDRLLNNTSNPAAMSGILVNNLNGQIAGGDLLLKAKEYNDAKSKMVAEHNRTSDLFDSEGAMKAAMANQDAINRASAYKLEGLKTGYAMKQGIDDARASAIGANMTGLANLLYGYAGTQYNNDLTGWYLKNVAKAENGGKLRKVRKPLI